MADAHQVGEGAGDSVELSRILLGLVVATMLPHNLPWVADKRVAAMLVSFIYAGYAVIGAPDPLRGAFIFALSAAWSTILILRRIPRSSGTAQVASAPSNTWNVLRRVVLYSVFIAGSLLLTASIYNSGEVVPFFDRILRENHVSITISGLLLAVIVGHEPVVRISTGLSDTQVRKPYVGIQGVDKFGIYLGWFERALVFMFIVGGQPSGAALALTAKSLARFPALERNEISGEYFLAGTFSSVLVAAVAGILTRLCLNLSPI
jgi:hypothetical protein